MSHEVINIIYHLTIKTVDVSAVAYNLVTVDEETGRVETHELKHLRFVQQQQIMICVCGTFIIIAIFELQDWTV